MSHYYFKLRDRPPWQSCVLRDYGGKNEAEFFAVATEAFFERGAEMSERAPDLYAELRRFYRCDPARGLGGAKEP
jgi:Mlc titration factor MtfA (ptsG expression regulator)